MKKENKKLPLEEKYSKACEVSIEEKFELEFKKAEYLNKVLAAIEDLAIKTETKKEEKDAKHAVARNEEASISGR